jgi:hypothetical protein
MGDDGAFERHVPATVRYLADVRDGLRRWLDHTVEERGRRFDIVLAASELVAAAMRAVPRVGADVAIRAWVDGSDVVIESRAEVDDHALVGGPAHAFDGNDGERGFSIVAALSEVFAVRGIPHGVVVQARLRRARFGAVRAG